MDEQLRPNPRVADKAHENVLRNAVTRFSIDFLKSLNMSGYYPADHPSITNVAAGPFKLLGDLRGECNEVSYVSSTGGGPGDILNVEGVFDEPVPFLDLMRSSMSEVFARKFMSYLEANHLVSFTVKTSISEENFNRFISVLVARKTKLEAGLGAETSFAEMLRAESISGVTVVSMDEVIGAQRALPWRVKIAMSRLAKDLGELPVFHNATDEELQAAKQLAIKDIIKPLRQTSFLRELLVNSDLIGSYVRELAQVDVESEIIQAMSSQSVEDVSWDMVRTLERTDWGASLKSDHNEFLGEAMRNSLKKLASRLAQDNLDHTHDFLRYLFERNIVEFSSLPVSLQRLVQGRKWANLYLNNPDTCHQKLNHAASIEEYESYSGTIVTMAPELLRMEKFDNLTVIMQLFIHHINDTSNPVRQGLARKALAELASEENISLLVPHARNSERSVRARPIQLLAALGEPGGLALVNLLGESPSSAVRRDILDVLTKVGPSLVNMLMGRLSIKGQQWYVYRNLVLILQNIGYKPAAPEIKHLASHLHPRVREQALFALYALSGDGATPTLLGAMRDRDSRVVRTSIALLARLKCRSVEYLGRLVELLSSDEADDGESQELLQLAALNAVSMVGVFMTGDDESVVSLVMEMVTGDRGKIWKRLFKRKDKVLSERVRVAACRTLAAIGTSVEAHELEAWLENAPMELRPVVQETVRQLLAR